MNILIATDKFKGSASADVAVNGIALGLMKVDASFKITKLPLADGGEGTLEILQKDQQFQKNTVITQNQIGEEITSYYLIKNKKAYIEMSKACGLHLTLDQKTSPMTTYTFGVGLMIKDAIDKGFNDIVLFAGGTSTNDGGMGIASALGIVFKDKEGNILKPQGSSLTQITHIDTSTSIFPQVGMITLCTDVNNILYGQNGAAHVYARQKGASEPEIEELDLGLKNISSIVYSNYGIDLQSIKGTGSAGGVAACLLPFFNGKIESGSDFIIEFLELENKIKECDLFITGEGKVDFQTLDGKIVSKVTSISKKYNKRTILIAGQCELSPIEIKSLGVCNSFTVLEQAKNDVKSAMSDISIHLINIGEKIGKIL